MTKKVDYSKLKNKVLEKYKTAEETLKFFMVNHEYFNVGIYCAKNFDKNKNKFSCRKADGTPSTLCKEKLTTVDFGGSGKHRYILDFILDIENEREGKTGKEDAYSFPSSFPFAMEIFIKLTKADKNQNLDNYVYVPVTTTDAPEKEKAKPYSTKYIERQKKNAMRNQASKKKFKLLIDGLCRSCTLDEKRRAVKIFNIGLNDYLVTDPDTKKTIKLERLFITEYNEDLTPDGSFRYNRELIPKGLLRTNCKRILFGIHLSHFFTKEKPIIFAEGHSDVVVNNSKRLATITSGSMTTKIGDNISKLKGKTIHFFYDLDLPGIEGVTDRITEVEMFNKTAKENDKIKYKVFLWSNKVIIDGEVKNISDYREQQKAVIKSLVGNTRRKITLSEEYLNKVTDLSLWKVLSETPKKKGYDWIDFHTENQEHPNYNNFIEPYLY